MIFVYPKTPNFLTKMECFFKYNFTQWCFTIGHKWSTSPTLLLNQLAIQSSEDKTGCPKPIFFEKHPKPIFFENILLC